MTAAKRAKASGSGHCVDESAYRTDPRVTRALAARLYDIDAHYPRYRTVDVGAGDGVIGKTLMDVGFLDVMGIEIREDLSAQALEHFPTVTVDFLASGRFEDVGLRAPQLVVMNPPRKEGLQFVRRALDWAKDDRATYPYARHKTVVALFSTHWMVSRERVAFHREHPAAIWFLPERPSFLGNGKFDSCEYAWFVWSTHPMIVPGTWEMLTMEPKPKRTYKAPPPLPNVDVDLEGVEMEGETWHAGRLMSSVGAST